MLRGSGGVTVLVKENLLSIGKCRRIFDEMSECVVFLFDGKTFNIEFDIMIFTYISPENSSIYEENANGLDMLQKNMMYILGFYPNARVVLMGDFNARTGNLLDYIENDNIDYIFPNGTSVDYATDSLHLKRNSKDIVVNRFGLSLVELCKVFNVHIVTGRVCGDVQGEYICNANNGKSLVDYCILSSELFPFLLNFYIDEEEFSDHYPVVCKIKFNMSSTNDQNVLQLDNFLQKYNAYKWDENKKHEFLFEFRRLFQEFYSKLTFPINDSDLILNKISHIYKQAGIQMKTKETFNSSATSKKSPWWDFECHQLKKVKTWLLRTFRKTNEESDFLHYKSAKNKFKSKCKQKRKSYEQSNRDKLICSTQPFTILENC